MVGGRAALGALEDAENVLFSSGMAALCAVLEEAVHGFVAMYPAVPAWRCALAILQLELGR